MGSSTSSATILAQSTIRRWRARVLTSVASSSPGHAGGPAKTPATTSERSRARRTASCAVAGCSPSSARRRSGAVPSSAAPQVDCAAAPRMPNGTVDAIASIASDARPSVAIQVREKGTGARLRAAGTGVRRAPGGAVPEEAVTMRSGFLVFAIAAVLTAASVAAASASSQDVVTYHNDNYRTGWFSNETTLTPGNVKASTFGLLQTVAVDGRVDAEPLVIFGQPIDNQGTHDVVYVATENNSLYAIDAESGGILWMENFGAAVPDSYKDGDDNVFPVMGILSTPVIDRSMNALFLVADTFNGSVDTFTLHALALNNGSDL